MNKMIWVLAILLATSSTAVAGNFAKKRKIRDHKVKNYWENSRLYRVADMDNDGDQDIVYITEVTGANDSRPRIKWLENKRKGKKWKDHKLHDAVVSYLQLDVIDVDGDSDLDVVTHNMHGPVAWWENKGKARKWKHREFHEDAERGAFALGDVDGDGDMDLVVSSRSQVLWHENEGKAKKFADAQPIGPKSYDRRTLAVADFDGEEGAEVVVNGDSLTMYKLQGDEWKQTDLGKDNSGGLLHSADFDNDGDLDLFTGNGGLALLINDGGEFTRTQIKAVRWSPQEIVVADFDGDRDNDIAFNIGMGNGVRVAINKGNGKFAEKPEHIGKENKHTHWTPTDLHAGDIDGDGDVDLLFNSLGVSFTDFAAWWENKSRKKGKMARTR